MTAVGFHGADAVNDENHQNDHGAEDLGQADEAVEGQVAGVVAGAVQHYLHGVVVHKEHQGHIAVSGVIVFHGIAAAAEEKAHQDPEQHQHHQKLDEEGGKAVLGAAVCGGDAGGQGQVLQQRRVDHDLAAAGGVEQGAEPDEGDAQRGAGGQTVKQTAQILGKAQLFYQQPCQHGAENGAVEEIVPLGVVQHGAEETGVLLVMAVPVDQPGQDHGEKQRQRQKQPKGGAPPAVGGVQGVGQGKAGGDAQEDNHGAPIDKGVADADSNLIHEDASSPGMAVAK